MRYGKVVVVLLVLGLSQLTEACSLATDRTGETGGDTESTRVAMEATLTAMESTEAALTPTQQTETPAQPAETPTQQTVTPTQPATAPTQPAVTPTQPAVTPTQVAVTPTQVAAPPTQVAVTPTQVAAPPTQVAAPPTQVPVSPSPTAQSVVPTPQSVVPTPTSTPKTGPTDEDLARKQLLEIQFAQNPRYPSEQIYVNNIPVFMYRVPNDLTALGFFLGYKVTHAQRDALFSYPFYGSAKEIEGELFRWIWREGAVDYLKSQGAKPYWLEP